MGILNSQKVIDISIDKNESIYKAIKLMDEAGRKLLIVKDNSTFSGLISIGDVQRAIIAKTDLNSSIAKVMRSEITVASQDDSMEHIQKMMLKRRTEFMPVLDDDKKLTDVIFWEDQFENSLPDKKKFDLPVVIMAGGKGSRLKPFSNIIPKPLFPFSDKTIVENIIDRFTSRGCHNFFMSVNYRADMIESYFKKLEEKNFEIKFFRETRPLGTAGSLQLLKDKISESFFVSNCDILVDCDYSEIVDFHREKGNEITLVSAIKNIEIPYGTLTTAEEGRLLSISEKPELTYFINTGLYILEPSVIDRIPVDKFYHITSLIEDIIDSDGRVGVFPVNQTSWTDLGEWPGYINATGLKIGPY